MLNKLILIVLISLTGCASVEPQRSVLANTPALEKGWSRVVFTAGQMVGLVNFDLKYKTQTGPVFIDGINVGSVARNEHIIVDLLPGTYEMSWIPHEPYKVFIEKTKISVALGQTRQYSCDMGQKGSGIMFGAIGVFASDYIYRGFLTEQPIKSDNRPVAYYKYKKT